MPGRVSTISFEVSLGLIVVAEAGRDDFRQHFAGVGHKRDSTVVVAQTNHVLPFVKGVDDRLFPELVHVSCYSRVDKDVVNTLRE